MYRQTERTRANALARRKAILEACRLAVADAGFSGATMKRVAAEAKCSVGTIYTYFRDHESLLAQTFTHAAGHELQVIIDVVTASATVKDGIHEVVKTFVQRSLDAKALGAALLYEPVPPAVALARLGFRMDYWSAISQLIARGITSGEVPAQDPYIAAQLISGSLDTALQVPLTQRLPLLAATTSREWGTTIDADHLVAELTNSCRRAVGVPA